MNFKMKLVELAKSAESAVSPAKGSAEDARYEMLVSLIASGQVKVEVDEWAAEDLKCLLAGKWMEEEPEVADVFSMKLFDSPISTWDEETVSDYKKTYKKNCRRYAHVDVLVVFAKLKFLAKKALPIAVLAVVAIALVSKARS